MSFHPANTPRQTLPDARCVSVGLRLSVVLSTLLVACGGLPLLRRLAH